MAGTWAPFSSFPPPGPSRNLQVRGGNKSRALVSLSFFLVLSILPALPVMAPADSNCPIDRSSWIKKMWYTYTMEYYSVIKKNEIIPFAATWLDLEIIILSKVSQKEKDKYHMISLICGI